MQNKSSYLWHAAIVFILLALVNVQGQQNPDAFMLNLQNEGPAVIPQSPESARFGRYGELPLNSSTGQMNFSLPIYSIEVDGNQWPISLNYNYGGLIVEEKQSLFGLGWNLNATGVVSREIRGLPDEAEFGYYSRLPIMDGSGRRPKDLVDQYMAFENDEDINTKGFDAWQLQTLSNLLNGIYDTEPDKYTVTVGSLNFSFKLNDVVYDQDNNNLITSCGVYMLSKHANKVEVLWSSGTDPDSPSNSFVTGFVVTDVHGTKYTFNVLEKSQPQGSYPELEAKPILSWKLKEIQFLNTQKITFYYDPNFIDDFSYTNSAIQTQGVFTVNENPNGLDPTNPYDENNLQTGASRYYESIKEGIIERQILDSITFPKGRIEFNYQNFDRMLCTNIALYSSSSTSPINTFVLGYDGPRDVLKTFSNNAESKYEMEYYFEDMMPNFINSVTDKPLARKRDLWKFYNGANNEWGLNLPNTSIDGVNKSPSELHTKIGALKRIIYPTKGNTNIFYEQNEIITENILESNYYENLPPTKRIFLELDAATSQEAIQTRTIEILYPTVAEISHRIEGDRALGGISVAMSRSDGKIYYDIICEESRIPNYPGNQNYFEVAPYLRDKMVDFDCFHNIPQMYPNLSEEFGYLDTDNGSGSTQDIITQHSGGESPRKKILMMPGTYNLEIFTTTLGAPVKAELEIQFYGSLTEPHPSAVNKQVGGIRVDYVKDCSSGSSEDCFITDYDYNDENGLSSGYLYLEPQITRKYSVTAQERTDPPFSGDLYTIDYITYFESPYTLSNPGMGSPVFYPYVKTTRKSSSLSLESNPLGTTKMYYSLPREVKIEQYPKRPTGRDLDKGQRYRTETYEQDGEDPHSVTSNNTAHFRGRIDLNKDYDEDNDHPWGLKVFLKQARFVDFREYSYSGNDFNEPIESTADIYIKRLHDVLPYRELDSKYVMTPGRSEVDGVTTRFSHSFNDNYQIDKETTIDSRGNETTKTIKYANEAGLNDMVAKNQLSTPVETETTYNGQTLSRSKTEFVLNGFGYKPSKIFMAKGNSDLEAKQQFDYDGTGKLRQVDRLLDSPNRPGEGNEKVLTSTAYIWGYSGEYPVAKIENATYNEVTTAGANLSNLQSATASLSDKKLVLESLRNALPDAFVSGYIYKPLVGISNMVDSRGYTTNYAYENLNRLLNVKDEDDKLLQEYDYAFRSTNYTNPDVIGQYPDLGGTITGPDNTDFGATLTYTVNPTGGSQEYHLTWYQDDVFLTTGVTELDITFDSGSSSTIRVDVTDNITGALHSITKTVTITSNIGAMALSVNPSSTGLVGETFTINSSGINQNLTGLTYAWYVDNSPAPEAFAGESGFQVSFATPGTHNVKLVVTHSETNSTAEVEATISVLEPLPSLVLTPSETLILSGEQITFTPSPPLGFHGIITIEWSLIGPSGTQVLGDLGGGAYTHIFNAPGIYEMVYSVTAPGLNQTEQASANITVSGGLAVGDIVPSAENILINTPVTFTMPNVTGGSGDYGFDWYVGNTIISNTSGDFTYNAFSSEGDYYIKLRVRDLNLNTDVETAPATRIDVWNSISQSQIGASSSPIFVGEAINFSTFNSGGSGSNTISWYLKFENNTETFEGNTAVLSKTFTTTGTYTVRQVIADNLIANHAVERSTTFEVYNNLNVGAIAASATEIVTGTSVTFTAPTVSGGSTNKSYEWLVNNVVRSTSSGNFTYNQFNSAGTYPIKFRVIDNELDVTEESTISVNVYDPLNNPEFTQTVNHIEVGDDLYMTLTNNGAGFDSMQFAWYIKFNSGNYSVIPGATDTNLNYDSFNSVGTYTVKFRVTHANVSTHFKEITRTVNVYGPIQISDSDITTPSPVDSNTSTYFNINSATGGSGSFEYEWDVININSNHTEGLSHRSEANRNVPSFIISDLFIGSAKIQCRVHDLNTNLYKTVSKTITVNGYGPLTAPIVLLVDTDNDPESAAYRLSASSSGGSQQYKFRWLVDNVVVQETTSNTYEHVLLDCSKQTAVVKCVVIDQITGAQAGPRTVNLSIAGNCGNQ